MCQEGPAPSPGAERVGRGGCRAAQWHRPEEGVPRVPGDRKGNRLLQTRPPRRAPPWEAGEEGGPQEEVAAAGACLAPRSPQKGLWRPQKEAHPEARPRGGEDGAKGWELGVQRPPPPGAGTRLRHRAGVSAEPPSPQRPRSGRRPRCQHPPRRPPQGPHPGPHPGAPTRRERPAGRPASPHSPASAAPAGSRDHFRFCPQGDSNLSPRRRARKLPHRRPAPPAPPAAPPASARDSNPGPQAAGPAPSPAPAGRAPRGPVGVPAGGADRAVRPHPRPQQSVGSGVTLPRWGLRGGSSCLGGAGVPRPWGCPQGAGRRQAWTRSAPHLLAGRGAHLHLTPHNFLCRAASPTGEDGKERQLHGSTFTRSEP